MSEGVEMTMDYDQYEAYHAAPQVLREYVYKLAKEIQTNNDILRYIAEHPEGRIALAKVALQGVENVNAILDDVIAKLEEKGAHDFV